jgi:hypothetical protein
MNSNYPGDRADLESICPNLVYVATITLQALYDEHAAEGGPSPDTRDENSIIADALGVAPVTDDAVLDAIWQRSTEGLDMVALATLHVEALGVTA